MSYAEQPTITWHESPVPDGMAVTQASVWALDPEDGRVLIQDRGKQHTSRYTLPGGKPEPEDGGDPLRTAAREALEESQIRVDVERAVYLGYQRVDWVEEGVEPYAQLRYAMPIAGYEPIAPDPDNGRLNRRYLVSLERAPELLGWGEHGEQQAAAAKRAGIDLGLPVETPAADGYRDVEKARYLVCHDYGMGALWWWVHARGVKEIMERIADVVVVNRAESVRSAEDWKLEELDIDAPDPNSLSSLKATRDEQRRQPGFGACLGRGTVYFRRDGEEDGEAYWLLEIGEDGYRTRQVVEYTDGQRLKSDEDDWFFNPPFDLYEPRWAQWEITREVFEEAWQTSTALPPDEG